MDITGIQIRLAAGQRDFQQIDLCAAELSCINLQGFILTRADLRHANLRSANLRQANLTMSRFLRD